METDANRIGAYKNELSSKLDHSFGDVVIFPDTYDACGHHCILNMSVYTLLMAESLEGLSLKINEKMLSSKITHNNVIMINHDIRKTSYVCMTIANMIA